MARTIQTPSLPGPTDWFYEWPAVDGEKRARAFALKNGSPFAFAGIWDRLKDEETREVLESFAIVTVEPSEWMAKYHDRMGVILKPKDYQRWLEEGEEHSLPLDLLRPDPEEEMKSWRVSVIRSKSRGLPPVSKRLDMDTTSFCLWRGISKARVPVCPWLFHWNALAR
ncbi:MAG TPA: SOS response-associated peptidase family protein [Terracidiphilus sp.]|jgi:putative SOS response-associated peptidase YedK